MLFGESTVPTKSITKSKKMMSIIPGNTFLVVSNKLRLANSVFLGSVPLIVYGIVLVQTMVPKAMHGNKYQAHSRPDSDLTTRIFEIFSHEC